MQGFNHRTLDIFYTDRSKAVFLGLVVLIVAFWMLAAGLTLMLCPVRCLIVVFSGSCLAL